MDVENGYSPGHDPAWRRSLLALVAVVVVLAGLQVAGLLARNPRADTGSKSFQSLATGDLYAKYALAGNYTKRDPRGYAEDALGYYEDALPWPAAYRRIGLTKQALLGRPGLPDLNRIDSPRATKGLPRAVVDKLKAEVKMWREVYARVPIGPRQAAGYAARVRDLNLGPLKQVAVSEVYSRAGQPRQARAALESAKDEAFRQIAAISVLALAMVSAGIVGLVLIVRFLVAFRSGSQSLPPLIPGSTLISSFLTYLVALILIGIFSASLAEALTSRQSIDLQAAASLLLQGMGIALAGGLGIARLRRDCVSSDLREIGVAARPFAQVARWGVGGYAAALPAVAGLVYVSNVIFGKLLRGLQTPENPLLPMALQGRLAFIVALLVGVIVAPIVEETAFRGMLYGGLRRAMAVWPAALLSGAIFSAIHPTFPEQFLPLMALGVVLAMVREKCGSLIPGMVCHALNNLMSLVLAYLMY